MKKLLTAALLSLAFAAAAQPLTFTGVGDDFFDLQIGEPMIASITHNGTGNFAVQAFSADGRPTLLVNVIGGYAGVVPVGIRGALPVEVTVNANGPWRIEMVPLHRAPQASRTVRGAGDAVLRVDHLGARALTASHDGRGNFAILGHGARWSLFVNEIGAYNGRVRLEAGTVYLEINADGNWELTLE
jgi:hypothetical protein